MTAGLLEIDLYAEQFHSLKEKRRLLASLKERLRRRFNVAVAESGGQDLWHSAQLTVAGVAASREHLQETFRQVEEFVAAHGAARISRLQARFF